MRLNRQFQHALPPGTDWVLKQHVERDICLLYHQLSAFSFIMGDLFYGSVFSLPYWDFLAFPGVEQCDADFIRDGCLVMLLAMASESIDGSGAYLVPHVPACLTSLDRLASTDDDTRRLVSTLRLALRTIIEGGRETPELLAAYTWVHKRYVRTYFTQLAQDFETNPYFADPTP